MLRDLARLLTTWVRSDQRSVGGKGFLFLLNQTKCTNHFFQDRRPDIQELAPFSSKHKAPIGRIQVFPMIKIIVICRVRMPPTSAAVWVWRQTHVRHHTKIVNAFLFHAFVSTCVVGKNLNTSNGSSMADDAITLSWIGGLESSF